MCIKTLNKNNPMIESDKDDFILDIDEGLELGFEIRVRLSMFIVSNFIYLFLIDSSTCKDGFQEYNYEIKLILLKNLIENVLLDSIVKIWQIKPELLPTHSQFIIYLYQRRCPPKLYQSEEKLQKIIKENKEN
ncbi:hypothetical protein RIR_jg366.t1 [Rhizophagus irregularis DAOM 181602=DAOM 197198]|nr:hypothetical protein RIR_jg366.t1 [Rhizophagus irregularis DAOM 181602=DAOM 197198]